MLISELRFIEIRGILYNRCNVSDDYRMVSILHGKYGDLGPGVLSIEICILLKCSGGTEVMEG